jgi:hypothetical protein
MQVEKLGEPRDVWIQCPLCDGLFYIERSFYEPKFDHIPLFCPHCRKEFRKEDAPRTWGR